MKFKKKPLSYWIILAIAGLAFVYRFNYQSLNDNFLSTKNTNLEQISNVSTSNDGGQSDDIDENASDAENINNKTYEEWISPKDIKNNQSLEYTFRNEKALNSHYKKHGIDMGFVSKEEYLDSANRVIANSAVMKKLEKEDGDEVYFLESTKELVIVSTDGFIRTYFIADDGIEYFNRQ